MHTCTKGSWVAEETVSGIEYRVVQLMRFYNNHIVTSHFRNIFSTSHSTRCANRLTNKCSCSNRLIINNIPKTRSLSCFLLNVFELRKTAHLPGRQASLLPKTAHPECFRDSPASHLLPLLRPKIGLHLC